MFNVSGKHLDVCVNDVRDSAFECPDCRVGAHRAKDILRDKNEETLLYIGSSNVLLMRGSLLAGRRDHRATAIMRDIVSYWLRERWLVVVHLGNDRTLANGLTEQLRKVGFPPPLFAAHARWRPKGATSLT